MEINDNDSVDSGRSTPEHLKKYSGTAGMSDGEDDDVDDEEKEEIDQDKIRTKKTKARTFSETLKMLDDDILAELDVN